MVGAQPTTPTLALLYPNPGPKLQALVLLVSLAIMYWLLTNGTRMVDKEARAAKMAKRKAKQA